MTRTTQTPSNAATISGATMSDFDSLDLPCRPGMGCPCREAERAAIVAWLRERALLRWGDAVDYAADIESGQHLRGDDE